MVDVTQWIPRWSLLLVAALSGAPVVAAAAPADPPSADASYAGSLAEGRQLMAHKQFAKAVTAFERAVAARPGDPTALSELGWAELCAGWPASALKFSRQAVAAAREPKLKAASLYNLGRAQEALGMLDEAKQSYAASQKLRPSRRVDAALARLGPGRLLAAKKLEGPFRSLAAYCKSFLDDFKDGACSGKLTPLDAPPKLAAPYREVGTFETCDGPHGDAGTTSNANLALRTDKGWFVAGDVMASGPQGDAKQHEAASFKAARLVDVDPGRPRALVVDYEHFSGRKGDYQSADKGVVVCGIGSAGPACTVITSEMTNPDDGSSDADEYRATIALLPGLTVSVKVKKTTGPDANLDSTLEPGTYRIVLP